MSKQISINWLKLVISAVAIAGITARIAFPDIKIDAVALGLIVVAVLPWLTELIESAKFPGGWEIKFRDIQAAGDRVTAGAEPKPADVSASAGVRPSFTAVADLDPNLALVGLRIEIEQRMRRLAERHGLDGGKRSLGSLIRELRQNELLPYNVASGLDELILAGNHAAHGAKVEPRVAQWAMNYGPTVLAALDELL